jgi:hypothetical protein
MLSAECFAGTDHRIPPFLRSEKTKGSLRRKDRAPSIIVRDRINRGKGGPPVLLAAGSWLIEGGRLGLSALCFRELLTADSRGIAGINTGLSNVF